MVLNLILWVNGGAGQYKLSFDYDYIVSLIFLFIKFN
jgi:hypothetical protein